LGFKLEAGLTLPRDAVLFLLVLFLLFKGVAGLEFLRPTFVPGAAEFMDAAGGAAGGAAEFMDAAGGAAEFIGAAEFAGAAGLLRPNDLLKKSILIDPSIIF
jgi:hypothetical protein